jgi:hypothetical protein
MNVEAQAHIRWALMALGLVHNKLTAMGVDKNDTSMVNLAAAESTLASVLAPLTRPQRELPPGKWKVEMPDGTYGRMPGDPPGPASVTAVIAGYVYDVEPGTGRYIASEPPIGFRLQKFNEEMQQRTAGVGGNDGR